MSRVHYRLYIDECGTDDTVNCHVPRHQFLSLTGVIVSVDHIRTTAAPRLEALKRKHLPHIDPDGPPVVLHRSDYVAGKGVFHPLQDPTKFAAFENDLHAFLNSVEHRVITVVLDKNAMLGMRHWRNKEPYHYCAEVLAEKFVQYLERRDGVGDVFAESRKEKKNRALSDAFRKICEVGTRFVPNPGRFSARLTTFDIAYRTKHHNVAGIQIADTYAKPSFDRIMFERDKSHARTAFSSRIGELLFLSKYDLSIGTGARWGYGMKYLP